MHNLQTIIEEAFEKSNQLSANNVQTSTFNAIHEVINQLDTGSLRIAEKVDNKWVIHPWLKKAVLLYFRINPNQLIEGNYCQFFDKVPAKYDSLNDEQFQQHNVRVVPNAIVRKGAFVGENSILMPSFVNIGAYIDSGCMIDTWATVGSCAQIGKNVHLSGGAGIGGVLEPLQANPTIIEDNCFIGARSEIVEGVIVEQNSVISMGVYLGQSTKIYNRLTGEISYGRIPAGSVVVPGSLPADDNSHSLYCAVIVKQIDAKTRAKVKINELLRNN